MACCRARVALAAGMLMAALSSWSSHAVHAQSGAVPGVPVIGFAQPVNQTGISGVGGAVRVSFRPPEFAGGSPVIEYRATATPVSGGTPVTVSGPRSPLTVTGLVNGVPYTIAIRAINGAGSGPASAPSNEVTPRASAIPALDPTVTWILPTNARLLSVSPAQFATTVQDLRSRIGDSSSLTRVKVGVSTFVGLVINDFDVDASTPKSQLRANMAEALDAIEAAVARAKPHNLPIGISVVSMMVRNRSLPNEWGPGDPGLAEARSADRRNMQWYSDETTALGWMTYSRYARRLRRVQELYVREFGRFVAEKMQQDPSILVAITGDGESEMTYEKFRDLLVPVNPADRRWADYSPFAVLEFRDWLTARGLYATGAELSGKAYAQAGRYKDDPSPAVDGNGDGHTLNADFGTSFTTWDLRYFNWSLGDTESAGALPRDLSVTFPGGTVGGFDPPRVWQPDNSWFEAWHLFRRLMIQRYNRDFARWMTESSNPALSGVPVDRWYSAQVPADFLFGNPPADSGVRHFTSASAHWTSDIWPYGGNGVTGYNVNAGGGGGSGPYFKTTPHVIPRMEALSERWGIVEWNPSDPYSWDRAVYDADVELVLRHRPSLLIPYRMVGNDLNNDETHWRVYNSGFEPALRDLVSRLENPTSPPPPSVTPGPPSSVNASVGGTTLTVTWSPVSGASSYEVEFRQSVEGPLLLALGAAGTALPLTIPPGVTGNFVAQVATVHAGGRSMLSSPAFFTIGPGGCASPPSVPSNLRAQVVTGFATASWSPVSGAGSYVLQAGVAPGESGLFNQNVGNQTSVGAPVPSGFQAYVRVQAVNDCGRSAFTAPVLLR